MVPTHLAQAQEVPASNTSANTNTPPFIPVITFDQFLSTNDAAARARSARDLTHAFKTSGFVYLFQHGVSQQLIDQASDQSAPFFDLSQQIKDQLVWRCTYPFSGLMWFKWSKMFNCGRAGPQAIRGYVATGLKRVTNVTDETEIAKLRAAAPDFKEILEIGREHDPEFSNYWPTTIELPNRLPSHHAFAA